MFPQGKYANLHVAKLEVYPNIIHYLNVHHVPDIRALVNATAFDARITALAWELVVDDVARLGGGEVKIGNWSGLNEKH